MKKYEIPEIEVVGVFGCDIITASPGTETTPKDDTDGIWDLDIG